MAGAAGGPAGANALAALLGNAARWATILGVGGSLAQTAMYTGTHAGALLRAGVVRQRAVRVRALFCVAPRAHAQTLKLVCAHSAVDGGEQAVLFDRLKGVLPHTSSEGTHFLVPWLQKAVIFDIRTRPRSISSVTGTKGASPAGRAAATPPRSCRRDARERAACARALAAARDARRASEPTLPLCARASRQGCGAVLLSDARSFAHHAPRSLRCRTQTCSR